MTSQAHFVQPPPVAVWLISLFALGEEGESILGDLLEEFSLLVSKSGMPSARKWYWRQTMKTVPQLAGVGFRTAPWMTTAAVVGGISLRKLLAPLVEPPIFAVLERYRVFEHHLGTTMFFLPLAIDIGQLITFLVIGLAIALVSRQREMVATITLGLLYGPIAAAGFIYAVTKTGNDALLWRLTWIFTDAFAIVTAGAIVRMHRLANKSRTSAA